MALQGTLDTFELPDVLRLLAATKKTGRLGLQTVRGDGSVWVDGGMVVGVQSTGMTSSDASEGLFDLLRAREGAFNFYADETSADPAAAAEVEPLLAAAEERLGEWREIEKVVPSMHAWVKLADELPAPEVTIDADAWKTVTAIGHGVTVTELGRTLDLSEVGVCRLVRDLVELGLGSVADDGVASPAATSTTDWSPAEPARFEPVTFEPPVPAAPAAPVVDLPPIAGVDDTEVYSFTRDEPVDEPADSAASEPAPAPVRAAADEVDELDEQEADEVARQLAQLSPKAAQAVAAAAAAETQAERDAALDLLDESDESVNRGLLLKFLGSVKS